MKPFTFGFEAKKATMDIPAGGYTAGIITADVVQNKARDGRTFEQMILKFDIAEGKYQHFFGKQYESSTFDNKKWKGIFRMNIPVEGTEYFEMNKSIFQNFAACLEESNPGYKWDWNEKGLTGKYIGVLLREREWEWEGKTGFAIECCSLITTQDARDGKFKIPKPKMLAKKEAPATTNAYLNYVANPPKLEDIDDGELPFEL